MTESHLPIWAPEVWISALDIGVVVFIWTLYRIYAYVIDFRQAKMDFSNDEYLKSISESDSPDDRMLAFVEAFERRVQTVSVNYTVEGCVTVGLALTCVGAISILNGQSEGAETAILSTLLAACLRAGWKFVLSRTKQEERLLFYRISMASRLSITEEPHEIA